MKSHTCAVCEGHGQINIGHDDDDSNGEIITCPRCHGEKQIDKVMTPDQVEAFMDGYHYKHKHKHKHKQRNPQEDIHHHVHEHIFYQDDPDRNNDSNEWELQDYMTLGLTRIFKS